MEPPDPPSESDCCNSGCTPCILDVYEAQLKKYQNQANSGAETTLNCVSLTSYTTFILTESKEIAPSVFILKFVYQDDKLKIPSCFRYSPGQYVLLRGKDHEGEFTRAYTPIPLEDENILGFTILVRVYDKGRMSRLLKKLQIGYKTSWRGPYGDFAINYKYKYLLFVAQGTGIAPLFAIINEMVHNEECESFVKLFFCCRDCNDILLREQLYRLCDFWNFSYEVFLSNCNNIETKYNEIVHKNKVTISC